MGGEVELGNLHALEASKSGKVTMEERREVSLLSLSNLSVCDSLLLIK